jgi:NADH:ubiquinone oxidoreductase subunit
MINLNGKRLLKYIDQSGNKYYVIEQGTGQEKRVVEYKGDADPASLDVKYHAWLHYLSDTVEEGRYQVRDIDNNATVEKCIHLPYKAWQPINKQESL